LFTLKSINMDRKNEEFVVARLSVGTPEEKDWALKSIDIPELKDGQVLLQTKYISVDPYLRNQSSADLNNPQKSMLIAEVVESKDHATLKKGNFVIGIMPWRRFIVSGGEGLRVVDPKMAPLSSYLSVLGVTGMTAYFGLLSVCSLKDNEEVLISGAAGAVGIIAGQIAKLKGCRVVGTAGGQDKCDLLVKEFGFDAAIDYKKHTTVAAMKDELKKVFPKGIDVFFENTGGPVTEAFFDLTNKFARVAVCGQISVYNATEEQKIGNFLAKMIYKSVNVRGFGVADFLPRFGEFIGDMAKWYGQGKIKSKETIYKGFTELPQAQIGLFSGKNTGKAMVEI